MGTTISARGQVVIPADLRNAHGLKPGTRLTVRWEDDAVVLRRAANPAATVEGERYPGVPALSLQQAVAFFRQQPRPRRKSNLKALREAAAAAVADKYRARR